MTVISPLLHSYLMPQLDCAIQRGISFEIIYSPLFRGNGVIRLVCAWSNMYDQRFNTPHAVAAVRRQVLSNAKVFLQYLDGRNTIVSRYM